MKINDNATSITDMRTLEREKVRLRKMCREMENELQLRFDHVKKNAGAMTFNSLFPNLNQGSGIWKIIVQIVKDGWKNKYTQTVLFSALITFIEFLGAKFGLKYLSRLFKKARESPETEYY